MGKHWHFSRFVFYCGVQTLHDVCSTLICLCVWVVSPHGVTQDFTQERQTEKHIHFQVPRERRNTAIGVVKRIHDVLAGAQFQVPWVVRIGQIFDSGPDFDPKSRRTKMSEFEWNSRSSRATVWDLALLKIDCVM